MPLAQERPAARARPSSASTTRVFSPATTSTPAACPTASRTSSEASSSSRLLAGTGPGEGSYAAGISDTGRITGGLTTESNVSDGWLLNFFQFSPLIDPNAGTAATQGTNPANISADGREVAGDYVDSANVVHGFIATP